MEKTITASHVTIYLKDLAQYPLCGKDSTNNIYFLSIRI
jgi:glutaredoxin-related protein